MSTTQHCNFFLGRDCLCGGWAWSTAYAHDEDSVSCWGSAAFSKIPKTLTLPKD